MKSCKVKKVKLRRTSIVNSREMAACLDEELDEYSDYEEEYWQESQEDQIEDGYSSEYNDDDKQSTATASTNSYAKRKSFTMDDFLVIDHMNDETDNKEDSPDVHCVRPAMCLPPPMKVKDNIDNTKVVQLPASIKVTSLSVSENMLRIRYGANYSEGKSFPRKFAVSYGSGKEGLAFLLITLLPCVVKEDDDITTIKITGYGVEELKIPAYPDFLDFRDIVEPLIVLKGGGALSKNGAYGESSTKMSTFKLKHVFDFESSVANFTQTKLLTFADVFEQKLSSNEQTTLIDGDCFVHGQFCGNCTEEKESFTTLIQCGHSFCDQCFKKYM